MAQPISGVVVSYNRADTIATCLRGLWFVDELIVVDKSSTDGTAEIAKTIADRVIVEPFRPLEEDSRQSAVEACAHDWVVCLDDDECLSLEAGQYLRREVEAPRALVYALPVRHYILGEHDELAYYWPDPKPRFFRKDAVRFRSTVHGEWDYRAEDRYVVPDGDGVCIHHLSHRDAAQWISKTNKYTSSANRVTFSSEGEDLIAFAHRAIDRYAAQCRGQSDYLSAVALLRAVYDIVDRVKGWERSQGRDGAEAFRAIGARLEAEYATASGRPTQNP